MNRPKLTILLAFAALVFLLAACNTSDNSLPLQTVTISSVTPGTLNPGEELTVTGTGFYQTSATVPIRIEVCGVTATATLVEPVTQRVILPPGGTVTVQTGSSLTITVPEEGFTAGDNRVLTVIRPDGSTATHPVSCHAPEVEPTPVTAVLQASATVTVAPATISFSAEGSTGEGELEASWDFGIEGATATGMQVSYEFPEAGTFSVTLTVTDATGAEAETTQEMTVHPALQAVIQHSEITGYAPVTVQFYASGSTGIAPLSYEWAFGDETGSSSEAAPSYEYLAAGDYTVTLSVTDANGDSSTGTLELVIPGPTPVNAVITADTIIGTAPLTVTFSSLASTGEGELETEWRFGILDATSNEAETRFTFMVGGTYEVTLTVTDETGASATATQAIAVDVAPASINFTAEPADLLPDSSVLVEADNYSETVALGGGSLSGLAPGEYTITPQPFERADLLDDQEVLSTWVAQPQVVTVAEGEERTVTLAFQPNVGALELDDTGLPELWDYTDSTLSLRTLDTPLGDPGDTGDWSSLTPGLYELTISTVEIQRGTSWNNRDWTEEYAPAQTTVQLAINSNATTLHEISYSFTPVGSLTISGVTGLPEDADPAPVLLDTDLTVIPGPWTDLTPGQYRLEFRNVQHVNEGGIERRFEANMDALELYSADPYSMDVYLSSNEDASYSSTYSLNDALLDVTITAPEGTNTADVTITDASGVAHHFTQATRNNNGDLGTFALYVPIGEYLVEYTAPPGYRLTGSRTPEGYHVVDESYFYADAKRPFPVTVAFEEIPGFPVIISTDPESLYVDDLEVHHAAGGTAANTSGTGTLAEIQLRPGQYSIPRLQSGATRQAHYEIDGQPYSITEHYSLTSSTDFTVTETTEPQHVTVPYGIDPGLAELTVSGLPAGTSPGDSTLTRWNGTWEELTSPNLSALPPGVYEVTYAPVMSGSVIYTANTERFEIHSTSTPTMLDVTYARVEFLPRQFGTVYSEHIEDVAVDAQGNIYLAGFYNGTDPDGHGEDDPRGNDILVIKLDPVGNLIWREAFGSAANDRANAVAVDINGDSIVLAGSTRGDLTSGTPFGGSTEEAFLMKLDPANGTIRWTEQFAIDNADRNTANDVTVDAQGNIYAVGTLNSNTVFVTSYTPNGAYRWSQTISSGGTDQGVALHLDGPDKLIVVGDTRGSFPGYQLQGSLDAFVVRLSTVNGDQEWLHQFGSPLVDYTHDVLVDSNGNIIWIGVDNDHADTSSSLTRIRKIGPTGDELLQRGFHNPEHSSYRGYVATFDISGNIILAGDASDGGFVMSLNPDHFTTDWNHELEAGATTWIRGLTLGASGTIVAAGATYGAIDGPNQGVTDPFVLIFSQ